MQNGKGFLKEFARAADLTVCDQADSFLQSGFWGSFKAQFGWEAFAFRVGWKTLASQQEKSLLVLRRRLAPIFALAYVPWGPELPDDVPFQPALEELAKLLKEELPKDTVFIRFDPPWLLDENNEALIPSAFVKAEVDIQVPDSVILDLTQPMESIVEHMKPKWRYNCRLALKKGVKVRQAEKSEVSVFYELLKETSKRDKIAIHSFDYYKTLFKNDLPEIRLYLAEHEGDVLAGIVTLFRGPEAVYLYGASSDKKRNLMPAYALQLKAIEDAKNYGCKKYDFFGIPPGNDKSHSMSGLYQFKTGFGGRIIHRTGSWDCPNNFIMYRIFSLVESLRSTLKSIKKILKNMNNK
jgi:lipid II:glycine glycyltransferase (peptidoglycan interpeptide bridge formation enzyme)